MIYYIGSVNALSLGNWLVDKFGVEDTWRFLSYKFNVISSDRNLNKVGYVQIDCEEDCLYFELAFGNKYQRV